MLTENNFLSIIPYEPVSKSAISEYDANGSELKTLFQQRILPFSVFVVMLNSCAPCRFPLEQMWGKQILLLLS